MFEFLFQSITILALLLLPFNKYCICHFCTKTTTFIKFLRNILLFVFKATITLVINTLNYFNSNMISILYLKINMLLYVHIYSKQKLCHKNYNCSAAKIAKNLYFSAKSVDLKVQSGLDSARAVKNGIHLLKNRWSRTQQEKKFMLRKRRNLHVYQK